MSFKLDKFVEELSSLSDSCVSLLEQYPNIGVWVASPICHSYWRYGGVNKYIWDCGKPVRRQFLSENTVKAQGPLSVTPEFKPFVCNDWGVQEISLINLQKRLITVKKSIYSNYRAFIGPECYAFDHEIVCEIDKLGISIPEIDDAIFQIAVLEDYYRYHKPKKKSPSLGILHRGLPANE